jgi:hypothetical protein
MQQLKTFQKRSTSVSQSTPIPVLNTKTTVYMQLTSSRRAIHSAAISLIRVTPSTGETTDTSWIWESLSGEYE